MHPPDRARRHRLADVPRAAAAVAELVAAPQVGVEAVEHVHAVLELPQRHVPERGPQGAPDVARRGLGGAQLVVDDLDPSVEQVRDGGVLVGLPLGLDGGDQALSVELGVAAVAPGLAAEVGLLAGDGVLTGVHTGTESRAQRLDRPSWHGMKVGRNPNNMPELMPASDHRSVPKKQEWPVYQAV